MNKFIMILTIIDLILRIVEIYISIKSRFENLFLAWYNIYEKQSYKFKAVK